MLDDSVERTLGRIEGKLDAVLAQAEQHETLDNTRFGEVFNRLGGMERWQAKVVGISLALGAIGGALIQWVSRQ